MRGEYERERLNELFDKGSPPLARGILISASDCGLLDGITPACAGNTFLAEMHRTGEGDHPRLRGEYFSNSSQTFGVRGSPPLARGIRIMRYIVVIWVGITPACAGNTIISYRSSRSFRDHPRLRGEYGD